MGRPVCFSLRRTKRAVCAKGETENTCKKANTKTLTVEVDLAGESGNADQGGRPDAQQRRHGFIEELRIHIGSLLEDDDIPTGALGGSGLYVCVRFAASVHSPTLNTTTTCVISRL